MMRAMTAILYPVAENADAALSRPQGRAARMREAERLAGQPVAFATEPVGPAFTTREAALDAYGGRLEDERPGRAAPAPEDRYCRLTETLAGRARPVAVTPAFAGGRRWPEPSAQPLRTVWRLEISYWRLAAATSGVEAPQARRARKRRRAAGLAPETLRTMAGQPLRPVEPQQPLDIGLFEARLPEAPHIVVPDE
ncbi:hypothetical protein [Phenylobacterium sp.]|jgi:hypothetical protein|uniref:hypothetical protein n=1 Tax=Phenylobacterium sp. TaxID=1871053 RepID=UPI002F424FCB